MIDGNHAGQTELLLDIVQMPFQIDEPFIQRFQILCAQVLHVNAAMGFQRPHGRNQHHGIRLNPGFAAFDVDEFFRAQIRAKTRLGDDNIGQFQRRLRGDHRIAAMGDIGERPAMDKHRIVFQGLDQIRQ